MVLIDAIVRYIRFDDKPCSQDFFPFFDPTAASPNFEKGKSPGKEVGLMIVMYSSQLSNFQLLFKLFSIFFFTFNP